MKKHILYTLFTSLSVTALYGCTLDPVPICIQGAVKCENNILSLCGENGEWIIKQNTCNLPECSLDDAEVCQPVDSHNFIIFSCYGDGNSNYWIPEICDSCDPETRKCDKTATNDRCTNRCISIDVPSDNQLYNVLLKCDKDQYLASYCQSGSVCDAFSATCVQCSNSNNESRCINELSSQIGYRYTCNNGQLTELTDGRCENDVSCMDAKSCGKCRNGNTKCETGNDKIGFLKQCENGDWKDQDKCDNDFSCKDENNCGECQNEMTKCTNDTNNIGQIITCTEGKWTNSASCEDRSCNPEMTGCADCKLNEETCMDENNTGHVKSCNQGQWAEKAPCQNNVSCTSDHTCGECHNGDTQCVDESDGGHIKICQNGKWEEQNECAYHVKCLDNKECGTCTDGETRCLDNSEGIGEMLICSNGSWTKDTSKPECNTSCLYGQTCTCDDDGYTNITLTDFNNRTLRAYCINSTQELFNFINAISRSDRYPTGNQDNTYILTKDMNITEDWEAKGILKGTFLGNHKTIQLNNIPINKSNAGFFSAIQNATVIDLNLNIKKIAVDRKAQNTYYSIGGLAGKADNSTIKNVSIESSILANNLYTTTEKKYPVSGSYSKYYLYYRGSYNIGMLVGSADNTRIISSNTKGAIETYYGINIGGIAGFLKNSSEITDSYSNIDIINGFSSNVEEEYTKIRTGFGASVSSNTQYQWDEVHPYPMGGLTGYTNNSSIKSSKSESELTGGYPSGGITGILDDDSSIDNSIYTGVINKKDEGMVQGYDNGKFNIKRLGKVGGISGYTKDSTISDSTVLSTEIQGRIYTGGLVGYADKNTQINRSSSISKLIVNGAAAGLVGKMSSATLTDSYHIGEINSSDENTSAITSDILSDSPTPIQNVYHIGKMNQTIIAGTINRTAEFSLKISNLFLNTGSECSEETEVLQISTDAYNRSESLFGCFNVSQTEPPALTYTKPSIPRNKSLLTNLGDAYTLAKCKVDIGDGLKTYILPIMKTPYPEELQEICTKCSNPDCTDDSFTD